MHVCSQMSNYACMFTESVIKNLFFYNLCVSDGEQIMNCTGFFCFNWKIIATVLLNLWNFIRIKELFLDLGYIYSHPKGLTLRKDEPSNAL